MAIVISNLEHAIVGPTGTVTSASYTIATNELVLLAMMAMDLGNSPAGNGTPTGSGVTNWTQVATSLINGDTTRRLSLWRGIGNGAAATMTFGGAGQEVFSHQLARVAGADLSRGTLMPGIEKATVLTGTIPSGTVLDTNTLTSILGASATFLTCGGNDGFLDNIDQPSGWTELSDHFSPTGNIIIHETSYKIAGEVHPQANLVSRTGTPSYATILCEILDPSSAVTGGFVPGAIVV